MDPWLLPLPVIVPLVAALLAFVLPRLGAAVGNLATWLNLGPVFMLALRVSSEGPVTGALGGWEPPLGILLRVDGLSAVMMLMTGLIAAAVSGYAGAYFHGPASKHYWSVWLILVTALNALFLSGDLFNLYVTLELLGIAAVALTGLDGGRGALVAAMRYLLATLAGSLTYLVGVALIYHAAGSVDIALVGSYCADNPASIPARVALVLMTAGLLIKCALFPLHFWLPAAHGSAPAPVSAALSALVVKGAYVILLRLWLEAFAPQAPLLFWPLSVLGGLAVLWGSLQALAQTRAKMLIAYSTVAQIGYLFLALPLAVAAPTAWSAIALLAFAHGLAKGAMFLAVGNLLSAAGHDRIAELDQVVHRLPLTVAAMLLAAISLMGLPPSGGFNAKWILLAAAVSQGHWWIVSVLLAGGLLAAMYLFRLVEQFFTRGGDPGERHAVPLRQELPPLLLALLAVGLGFLSVPWLELAAAGGALAPAGGAG